MLTKVIFKNFKSFKNQTIIDINKTASEILNTPNTFNDVLKGVCFFGSNATGKTGALLAIKLLLELIFNEEKINYNNYKYLDNKNFMNFDYYFKFDENEIIYSICIDDKINKETLKINNNIYYEKENRETLYLKELESDVKVKKLYNYLKNSMSFNLSLFNHNEETYKILNGYLEEYDVDEINEFLKQYNFPYYLEYNDKLYFVRKNFKIEFSKESYGNKMLINILAMLNLVVRKKGMLLIDEFSNSLHNKLAELIIKYFFNKANGSQLFFVSHSTNLLKMSLLRLDQIYVVDLNEEGSYLNRLSNYNIRLGQNIEKMYLSGMFGGVPLYDSLE